jgi:protein O-mannosyl-transferase
MSDRLRKRERTQGQAKYTSHDGALNATVHDKKTNIRSRTIWYLALTVFVLIAHCPALISGFVWDDITFLDTWLPEFNSFASFFSPPAGLREWPTSYYRPLGVLSLKIDHLLFGEVAMGWHIINLILHLIVTLQVYELSRLIFTPTFTGSLASWASSAVFAIHPIHVESVNWISGRSDVLAATFALCSLFCYLRYMNQGSYLQAFGANVCLLIGLLCKEVALAVVLLAPVCYLLHSWGKPIQRSRPSESSEQMHLIGRLRNLLLNSVSAKRGLIMLCANATTLAIYLVLRLSASATTGDSSTLLSFDTISRLLRATAFYLGQLLVLQPQVIYPPDHFVPTLGVSVFVLAAAWAITVLVTLKIRAVAAPLLIGWLWVFISLSPSLLVIIFSLDPNSISERYLYLPSIGFCLMVGWCFGFLANLLSRLRYLQQVSYCILGSILLVGLNQSIKYGMYWTSNLTVWTYVVELVPEHTIAWINLSNEYQKHGDAQKRLAACQKAADSAPTNFRTFENLAQANRDMGRFREAAESARKAIELNPNSEGAYLELGIAEASRGDSKTAEKCFEKALELNPSSDQAHVNLAYLYRDQTERAIAHLLLAVEFNPGNAMAFNNLGTQFANSNRRDDAIQCFRQAILLNPNLELAKNNLQAILATSE